MESSSSKKKEVFVKTENLSERRKTQELVEKLQAQKEKRKLAEKYANIRSLADDSDDGEEDAADWYRKVKAADSRKRTSGTDLRNDSTKKRKTDGRDYSSKDIQGLAIGHKVDSFEEGKQVILTLKDKNILDEDEDVLQNVNLIDDEKAEKSNENKKKRSDYKPWDDDEFNYDGSKKNLLSKYDEEIEGTKESVFRIGENIQKAKTLKDFHEESFNSGRMFSTLSEFKVASEYYTADEMVKFKKTKRKGALRGKALKKKKEESFEIEEIEKNENDHGTRNSKNISESSKAKSSEVKLDISQLDNEEDEEDDAFGPDEDLSSVHIEEDQAEKELQFALQKARKLKLKEISTVEENVAKIAETVKNIKKEPENEFTSEFIPNSVVESTGTSGLVLNRTSEFCRNLGSSNNNDFDDGDELIKMEVDSDLSNSDNEQSIENRRFTDDEDDDDDDNDDYDKKREYKEKIKNQPILEEEPQLTSGIAGALQLALRKGYLDREQKKQTGTSKMSGLISAQAYAIEEKFNDNEFSNRRDRYSGEISAFKEKEGYKPDFKLDYVDDKGRQMNEKEAFRHLSHKFHGKTSGKNKTDKRLKKLEQESKIRQMASTDTPLNTLKLLQQKQQSLKTPYLILTGKDAEASKLLKGSKKKK